MGRVESSAMIILLFGIVGIILAMVEYALYGMNVMVNAWVDSQTTLYAIMFFTVIICELVGVVVSAGQ